MFSPRSSIKIGFYSKFLIFIFIGVLVGLLILISEVSKSEHISFKNSFVTPFRFRHSNKPISYSSFKTLPSSLPSSSSISTATPIKETTLVSPSTITPLPSDAVLVVGGTGKINVPLRLHSYIYNNNNNNNILIHIYIQ